MKGRLGRAAYVYTGARDLSARRVKATIEVDGVRFFQGRISCVLAGNVAKVLGGIEAFPGAHPDDGLLELGVVTAKDPAEWSRALGRIMMRRAGESPFIKVTRGKQFRVRFDRPFPYELDGGARTTVTKMRVKVHPGAITICVPRGGGLASTARLTAVGRRRNRSTEWAEAAAPNLPSAQERARPGLPVH